MEHGHGNPIWFVTVDPVSFRYLSILLGAVSLLTLASYMALGDASPMASLGIGGFERWIVYPVIVWIIAFGGYLLGRADAWTHHTGARSVVDGPGPASTARLT